ncbi:MAG TPA: DUF4125 family protein [Desulfovibrio sp.]|jgi:hypothetical protein|uniref:DUF4125 family protein n=1 Tax=Desulfovibrio TaxID=872 RepID=UPI0003FD576D|nr:MULTISPECIES: DUF4125 family protein [Desulfovibrio]MDY0306496.1 DUF4125 family protein [Desulfovibrionaceae bacterium]HMM38220.1 DUF4125 family protein [Desulfovibrio sp.]
MITRKDLLSEIIERELAMFQSVNNRGGRADCQDMPESFRLMREITHAVLSVAFLESYGQDLRRAERDGRNFMTEKYAIMEGQIAPINPDPRIPEIADQETDWREAVAAEFPHAVEPGGSEAFRRYLRAELQTYSPGTIGAYAECVDAARREGRNLARERYDLLMSKLGFGSLAEREASVERGG